ncbi:MAG TPA: TonB-dependent receptor [Vicinamibacterales bacterium]|nr:TonB-dependent receptor [Vicinamibacterales bacterium]
MGRLQHSGSWIRQLYTSCVAFVVVCWLTPAAFAQVQTGSILVKVVDEQQGALPGATVTAASPMLPTPMIGTTDNSGVYRFPSLPPADYALTVELGGFRTATRAGIVVSVGQTTLLNFTLSVGALEETVTVTGDSPVIDTTSANVNVNLSQEMLQATPSGHDIWSLLEAKVPGVVLSRPDVGGASGNSQGGFVARGTTSQQNTYFVNGISVGSPTSIGNTSLYFDYNSFEEIQVSTSALDMSVGTPGVFLNMVTKTGGDRYSGLALYSYEGHQLQSSNLDTNLMNFGLGNQAGRVDLLSDANAQLGGPLVKNKVRFFISHRDWRDNIGIAGFPEIDKTINRTTSVSSTYQLNNRNRLTGYMAQNYFIRPTFGSSASVSPIATTYEDNHFQLYQALWNFVMSNTAFIDARVSFQELYFPLFQKGGDVQSLLDLSTNIRQLNAANETISTRQRLQTSMNVQKFIDRALGGRHELRVGVDNQHSPVTTDVAGGDVNLTYRSQPAPTASTAILSNTPLTSRQALNLLAIFAQDSYTVGRLTVSGGVRWERLEGYLPAQSSPASLYFPDAQRSFDEIRNVISWKGAAPRASVVYDLFGKGKTALKGAVGRYLYQISTDTINGVNKNFLSSATYTWTDVNRDLQFTPDERGALLSRSGAAVTNFDPKIKRPYTDEFLIGIDHELVPSVKVSVVATYRRERNLIGSVDLGVPFSAYRLIDRVDLGPDGLTGTSDDRSFKVWDQDPATRGQERLVTTNPDGLNQRYRGIEFSANKRFSNRWQILTGYTFARTTVDATNVSNPNALINARGSTNFDRPHTFKVTGSYELPYDIAVSGNFHIQSGLPIARTQTFALTQGNVTINMTSPGSDRLDPLSTVDTRIAKVFRSNRQSLELSLDAFNLFNANTVYNVRTLTGRINLNVGGVPTGAVINQPQYLSPTAILSPRLLKVGFAYRF